MFFKNKIEEYYI